MSLGKGKKYKAAIKELYLIQLLVYKVSIWLSLCRLNITPAKTFRIIKANIYIDSLHAQALEPVLSTPVSINSLNVRNTLLLLPSFCGRERRVTEWRGACPRQPAELSLPSSLTPESIHLAVNTTHRSEYLKYGKFFSSRV